jgi:hypothetical protein
MRTLLQLAPLSLFPLSALAIALGHAHDQIERIRTQLRLDQAARDREERRRP